MKLYFTFKLNKSVFLLLCTRTKENVPPAASWPGSQRKLLLPRCSLLESFQESSIGIEFPSRFIREIIGQITVCPDSIQVEIGG